MSRSVFKRAGFAALVAASLSTALTAPAQAQVFEEGDGPGVVCNGLGTKLFSLADPYSCRAGDKLYSEFKIEHGSSSFNGAAFSISDDDPDHTIGWTGSFLASNSPFSYSYRMQIVGAGVGTRQFHQMKTGATSSATGTNAWTKTLSAVPAPTPSSVTSTETSVGGESGIATFGSGVTDVIFTSTLTVTAGRVGVFTDSVTQKDLTKVPGPLPILGAGMAFGFSRKLRKRIGVTA
jgi:hypothetical protein